MKPVANFILGFFLSSVSYAFDCQNIPDFKPIETQSVKISVDRFYWSIEEGRLVEKSEDVCSNTGTISAYDVRGREDEAYYCLKPQAHEIFSCSTTMNDKKADVVVLPATWIRNWNPYDVREYRFHAYVTDLADPAIYLDVFSRVLLTKLSKDNVIIDGAIRNGPRGEKEGYFIRVQFQR